jgi:hypothetical protein
MRRLVENDECCRAERQQSRHQDRDSMYLDFLATHSRVFTVVTDPLEADNWLHTTKSKFGLLDCTEFRKLCTWPNNCEAQLEPGRLHTLPPYLLMTTFHGASFALPSVLTTFYGSALHQAEGISRSRVGEPFRIKLHQTIQQPGPIWLISY